MVTNNNIMTKKEWNKGIEFKQNQNSWDSNTNSWSSEAQVIMQREKLNMHTIILPAIKIFMWRENR
jgi:hypothetical protein